MTAKELTAEARACAKDARSLLARVGNLQCELGDWQQARLSEIPSWAFGSADQIERHARFAARAYGRTHDVVAALDKIDPKRSETRVLGLHSETPLRGRA